LQEINSIPKAVDDFFSAFSGDLCFLIPKHPIATWNMLKTLFAEAVLFASVFF